MCDTPVNSVSSRERVTVSPHVCRDSFTCVTRLIHMCYMTHSHVWHDSITRVTPVNSVSRRGKVTVSSHVWHDSFTCVTWLLCTCHTCEQRVKPRKSHGEFTCVILLIHMCDMTHLHVSHLWTAYQAARESQSVHTCDMTHSHVWQDLFTCVTWLIHMLTHLHVSHLWTAYQAAKESRWVHMCDMTHSHAWHDSFTCVTWLIYTCHTCEQRVKPRERHTKFSQNRHRFGQHWQNFSKVSPPLHWKRKLNFEPTFEKFYSARIATILGSIDRNSQRLAQYSFCMVNYQRTDLWEFLPTRV